ncbi:hypothetical protein PMI30_03476 [Pseudomonas sp. GM50]|nr:hypothetical protein PMI30_03476 [Pseudomonas sp. GM50]
MVRVLLWRGGLPPFGCEAVVKSVYLNLAGGMGCLGYLGYLGAASRPNGGKPPRHRQAPSPQILLTTVKK